MFWSARVVFTFISPFYLITWADGLSEIVYLPPRGWGTLYLPHTCEIILGILLSPFYLIASLTVDCEKRVHIGWLHQYTCRRMNSWNKHSSPILFKTFSKYQDMNTHLVYLAHIFTMNLSSSKLIHSTLKIMSHIATSHNSHTKVIGKVKMVKIGKFHSSVWPNF